MAGLLPALARRDADLVSRLQDEPVHGLIRAVESLTHRVHAAKRSRDVLLENDVRAQRFVVEDEIARRTEPSDRMAALERYVVKPWHEGGIVLFQEDESDVQIWPDFDGAPSFTLADVVKAAFRDHMSREGH